MRVFLLSHVSNKEKGAKSPLLAASVEEITLSFYIYYIIILIESLCLNFLLFDKLLFIRANSPQMWDTLNGRVDSSPRLNMCQDTLGQYLFKECEHDITGPSFLFWSCHNKMWTHIWKGGGRQREQNWVSRQIFWKKFLIILPTTWTWTSTFVLSQQ